MTARWGAHAPGAGAGPPRRPRSEDEGDSVREGPVREIDLATRRDDLDELETRVDRGVVDLADPYVGGDGTRTDGEQRGADSEFRQRPRDPEITGIGTP